MTFRFHCLVFALLLSPLTACSGGSTSSTDTSTVPDTPDVTVPDTDTPQTVSADPITRTQSTSLNNSLITASGLVGGGDVIYVCDGNQVRALSATDLSDGATATLQNPCAAMAQSGDYLVVGEQDGDWVLLDTTNDLAETARVAGPNVFSFAVGPDTIVGCAGTNGLSLAPLDLAVEPVASSVASDARAGLFLADGTLLVADGTHGLKHIDVSTDGGPALVTARDTDGITVGLTALADGHVAVAQVEYGVLIVDSTDAELSDVGNLEFPGMTLDIATDDGALIAAGWDALRLVDIQDHADPALLAREFFYPGEASFGRVMAAERSGDGFVVAGTDHVTLMTVLTNAVSPEFSPHQRVIQIEVLEGSSTGSTGALIYNTGKEELVVTDLESTDPRIIICTGICGDPVDDVVADADGVAFFEIQTTTGESMEAALTMKTNDPDFPEFTLPIRVNPTLLKVGDPAPDFVMPGVYGEMVNLSALKGQVVYLKLFNSL